LERGAFYQRERASVNEKTCAIDTVKPTALGSRLHRSRSLVSSRRPPPADPLATVLAALVEPLASRSRDPLRRVGLAWGEVCGPVLARHIRPLTFIDGVLAVGASDPQWRDAAFQQREAIVRGLRRYVPELRYIRLETTAAAPSQPPSRPPPPPPADPRTEGIGDPALRTAFDGLLAARAAGSVPDDGST
jgi:hypothetical protein